MANDAAAMIAAAKARIDNLDADQVETELASGEAVLIDVREPDELVNGRIPGAIKVPRGMLASPADPTSPDHREPFDPKKRVILHCAGGGRSALAGAELKDLGYSSVANLEGGIAAWKKAGKPVE